MQSTTTIKTSENSYNKYLIKQAEFKNLVKNIQYTLQSKYYKLQGVSFDEFVRLNWNISKAQAYRYLISAKVLDQLQEFQIQPCYERLCRTLYSYAKTPKQMKLLWSAIVQKTKGKPHLINSSHVAKTWKELCKDKKYNDICHFEDKIMAKIDETLKNYSKKMKSKNLKKDLTKVKDEEEDEVEEVEVEVEEEEEKISEIESPKEVIPKKEESKVYLSPPVNPVNDVSYRDVETSTKSLSTPFDSLSPVTETFSPISESFSPMNECHIVNYNITTPKDTCNNNNNNNGVIFYNNNNTNTYIKVNDPNMNKYYIQTNNTIEYTTTTPITTEITTTTIPTEKSIITVPITHAQINTAPIHTAPINTAPIHTTPINAAPINTAPIHTTPINAAPINTINTTPMNTTTITPINTAQLSATPVNTTTNNTNYNYNNNCNNYYISNNNNNNIIYTNNNNYNNTINNNNFYPVVNNTNNNNNSNNRIIYFN